MLIACKEEDTPTVKEDIVVTDTDTSETSNDTLTSVPDFELTETKKPVFFDYTSTGCPGCGSWGAPTFEQIAKEQGESIVPIAVHIKYGDPMITDVSNAIAENRNGQRYTPQLWVNNTNGMVLNGGSINTTGTINKITADLETIKTEAPEMAIGVGSIVNGDIFKVRYKSKVLADITGEYYLAIYLMEDGILYRQSSAATNPFEHNYVIRKSNGGGFGTQISQNELTKNTTITGTVEFEIDPNWDKEKLSVSAIIWKKEGTNYYVINANSDNL